MILGNPLMLGGGSGKRLYLYHEGEIHNVISQKKSGSTGSFSLTNTNNVLEAKVVYSSGQYAINCYFGTPDKIDITDYNRLVINIKSATHQSQTGGATRIGLLNNFATSGLNEINRWSWGPLIVMNYGITTPTELTLDISSATGMYYVGIGIFSGGDVRTTILQTTEWRLEK